MATISREIREGLQLQGKDEIVAYRLDTSNCSLDPSAPSTPAGVACTIWTVTEVAGLITYTDVTATKMSGAATVSGQYITLPLVTSLAAGTLYRVEVKFTLEGNTFEPYAMIQAET